MNFSDFLKRVFKKIRYLLEAVIVKFGLWIFYVMGQERASNIAAKIAQFVGKKIAVHKLAYNNLSKAMPELSEKEKEKILDDMWDNLGRVVGEYPHVAKYSHEEIGKIFDISQEAVDIIKKLKESKKGGIIFSGHIGNWEIGPKVFLNQGLKVSTVYRPLNNPYVEKMTASIRKTDLITKSSNGNRKIIETIKAEGFILIMADQKISEGEPIKFFNDDAITTTSIARIALKYDIPVIPARAIRIGKSFKFLASVEEPLTIKRTKDLNADITNLTCEINRKLEKWIRQYPSQWFWVHNRWKK